MSRSSRGVNSIVGRQYEAGRFGTEGEATVFRSWSRLAYLVCRKTQREVVLSLSMGAIEDGGREKVKKAVGGSGTRN